MKNLLFIMWQKTFIEHINEEYLFLALSYKSGPHFSSPMKKISFVIFNKNNTCFKSF